MARRSNASASSDVALVATGKSRTEVSALRHLREAYDALALSGARSAPEADGDAPAYSLDASARPSPSTRPAAGRGRVLETVRALQQSSASPVPPNRDVFDRWLVLETLAQAIEGDAVALQREIQACEARASSVRQLPAQGFDSTTADAKLLVLCEVLGAEPFASYARDLFGELAQLRQRFGLYGDALRQFQEQVQIRCIGAHRMNEVLTRQEWLEIANSSLTALRLVDDGDDPWLVSHFPVLMQHCSPPRRSVRDDESSVAVLELLQLLERLPPARDRLVALCFEQISDVRRGTGIVPPPEGIRPHKLAALAKQSHADTLCSRAEMDSILAWLDDGFDDERSDVSRAAFVNFHASVSDTYAREDAEFVAFLMRVWQFEIPPELGVGDVVANYEARCQEITNMTRKREVLKKLDNLRAGLPSKLASLRHLMGQVETVVVQTGEQFERLATHQQLSSTTLLGLRKLHLNGLSLREFPVFVVVLPLLEELDLGDNQLREPLPLVTIGGMKTLQKLVLRDNFLSDRSFAIASPDPEMAIWQGLNGLTALDISRNQLTMVPGVVIQLKSLKQLNLASNKLRERGITVETATKWASQGSPQLQMLDMRGNELSALPDVVFTTGKCSLEVLYAQDNHLTEVPSPFGLLEGLQAAVFSRNRLKHLGTSDLTPLLIRCKRLKELSLDHNQLRVFPVQSCIVPSSVDTVYAVCWPKNRLRVLPSLDNLAFQACEELDLRGNVLTEISDPFFPAFPKLRACHLQQNAIQRLPESISSCKRLQVLEIYENKLEYVPPGLASLRELAVLNLRENQLTAIPSDWHAFAQYQDHSHHTKPRVLQTLYLQRNPLRNKVLQSLVDGALGNGGLVSTTGAGASTTTPFKSSATQICEMYVRKLIDTLKESVPVQSLARAVHAETLDAPEENDDEDDGEDGGEDRGVPSKWRIRRRRWKGRARFVIQHIETQLKTRCDTTESGRARLMLGHKAFQKLLQKLLVASTKKELQLVSERFQTNGDGVDGLAFLCGVEAVGLFNALPPLTYERSGAFRSKDQARCESVHKPVDAVASILQYLHVAHEQKLKPPDPTPAVEATIRPRSAPAKTSQARRPLSAKSSRETKPKAPPAGAPVRTSQPGGRDDAGAAHQVHRSQLERQRQRIQVLEQQLLDQHLLRLAEQNAHRGAESLPREESPPRGPPHRDQTDQEDVRSASHQAANSSVTHSVLVHVKQLNREEIAAAGPAERVVLAMPRDATVGQLKQAITTRLGVDVARQVLIARDVSTARDHIRLQDALPLAAYFQGGSLSSSRWHVSLLVSESVRIVDWSKVAKAQASTRVAGVNDRDVACRDE